MKSGMRPSLLRTALPAVALAGALLAAALVAADAPLLGGEARQGVSDAARTGAAVAFAVVTFAVGLLIAIAAAVKRGEARLGRRRRGPFARSLGLIVAVAVLVLAASGGGWVAADWFQRGDTSSQVSGRTCGGRADPCPRPTPADDRRDERPEPDRKAPVWLLVAVAVAWFVAFPLALYRLTRPRLRGRTEEEGGVAESAAAAALAAIGPPRDDREAILAAYAAMERSFAAAGYARGRSEAPREYLERLLARLDGDRAAASRRLTALFEQARFAVEPVGAADRREAEAALETLRKVPRDVGGTVVVGQERPA